MKYTSFALLGVLLAGPALADFSVDMEAGRRESSFDTGKVSAKNYSNEARLSLGYQLEGLTGLPLTTGLSFSTAKYDNFTGASDLTTDAVHNSVSLDFGLIGSHESLLTPFAKLRYTLYSKGEREFDGIETATGYDARGTETFRERGVDVSVGTYFPLMSFVKGMVAVDIGSKMLEIRESKVDEYQINLAGGPDRLQSLGKTKDNSIGYNSVSVLLGLSAQL
ncbi:hypothetical protein [Pseudobacteriovorax antillogorgiicola]|uniref:Outer membrane protein beta-barrel domain-containing protein n=1 Tax=Pseudobacteriovorax antillogorgiicola TaxID=1513793 RepID=A0A1Y6BBR8_9BACT|nr:hypothetical protein [Pseudobacteriovorax antillogorgiicola]TCS57364.1 hypothetical protein EDD56_103104 [Pseudobacteriovorax antillogorgiicola]SMF01969.1 hypothetical protein SAMN06296036_103229 [Pseudobacteriovorax antillogorgiicola]